MKASALIACIAIVAAFAFLAACQPDQPGRNGFLHGMPLR